MLVVTLFVGLTIFGLWAIYAASGAIFSSLKQRKALRCLEQAQQKAREGDLSGSLGLFLKAESNWTLDVEHRSHKATMTDLEQYAKIAAGIAHAVGRESAVAHADIRATLREMRETAPYRKGFHVSVGRSSSA